MQVSGQATVFRKERESMSGKWYSYAVGVSSKRQDGSWVSSYLPAKFRKGVVVENKARINIKDGFLTAREFESNGNKKSIVELMILDFETVEQKNETGFSALTDDDIPF